MASALFSRIKGESSFCVLSGAQAVQAWNVLFSGGVLGQAGFPTPCSGSSCVVGVLLSLLRPLGASPPGQQLGVGFCEQLLPLSWELGPWDLALSLMSLSSPVSDVCFPSQFWDL